MIETVLNRPVLFTAKTHRHRLNAGEPTDGLKRRDKLLDKLHILGENPGGIPQGAHKVRLPGEARDRRTIGDESYQRRERCGKNYHKKHEHIMMKQTSH